MRLKLFLLTIPVLIFSVGVIRAQDQKQEVHFSAFPDERLKAAAITWQHHFGYRKEEPRNVYVLMTQGGFRAPTSDDFETLTQTWLKEHPEAEAIVVYKLSPVMTSMPDSVMKSVWVVSGGDYLNVYLVRQGAVPAGTQVLNPGDETSLARDEYEKVKEQMWAAEELARKDKLGIWKNPPPE